MDDFDKQKIIFPAIMSGGAFFALEDKKIEILAPGNIIVANNDTIKLENILKYLVEFGYWALKKFYMGGGIEGELKVNRLEKLPVPTKINTTCTIEDIYSSFHLSTEEISAMSSEE